MAAGVLGELLTGQSLLQQFVTAEPFVLSVALLLSVASLAPLLQGEEEGEEVFGPFEPRAEVLNGEFGSGG